MENKDTIIVRLIGEHGDGVISIHETPDEMKIRIYQKFGYEAIGSIIKSNSPKSCDALRKLGEALREEGGVELTQEALKKLFDEFRKGTISG